MLTQERLPTVIGNGGDLLRGEQVCEPLHVGPRHLLDGDGALRQARHATLFGLARSTETLLQQLLDRIETNAVVGNVDLVAALPPVRR